MCLLIKGQYEAPPIVSFRDAIEEALSYRDPDEIANESLALWSSLYGTGAFDPNSTFMKVKLFDGLPEGVMSVDGETCEAMGTDSTEVELRKLLAEVGDEVGTTGELAKRTTPDDPDFDEVAEFEAVLRAVMRAR